MLASLWNDKRVSEQMEQKGRKRQIMADQNEWIKPNKQNEWIAKKRGRELSKVKVSTQLLQALVSFIYLRRSSFATLTQMANQIVDRQTFLEVMTLKLRPIKRNIAARKLWADGRFVFIFELLPALCSVESSNTHHFQSHYHHSIDSAFNLTFNTERHRFTYSTAVTLNIKYFIFFLRNPIISFDGNFYSLWWTNGIHGFAIILFIAFSVF